jgi:hypothetical protein
MTALGTLYEETNAKTASYVVRVAGVSYVVESLSYNFAMGEVPMASFEIVNPLPSLIVYSAPVEIYAGYNGLLQLVFTGQVETPTPGARTTSVECSGLSRLLRVPYKRLVRVINGQDANVIVAGMLDDAGVINYVVDLEAWVVGAIVTTTLEFQSWDNAINKVAMVDGSPWYELPTGQIRVELRDPWPSPSFFRQYYSGDLRSLSESEREQYIAGTLPLTAIQPANIVNADSQPRVRDGVRQTTLLSNVRNQVYVLGAVLDITGPDGETTSTRIEAQAVNTGVPWIQGGRLQDWTFDNELIDTQAKANTVAARKFTYVSRLDQRVALSVDGDPEIQLGMTVNVEDPAYTGITGNWFVYGYQGRMDASGYVTQFDLRGGVNAGITPLLAPVADFIMANEFTQFSKIKQVTPSTTGAILVTFDGRSSFDPDGTIVSWAWADDQGNTGSGPIIQFAYDEALGSIDMTLTVTDNDGLTDSITKTLNIATSAQSCGDAGSCIIFAAIKTHMSVSEDGGASWTDISKAAAAATGDFISVATSSQSAFAGPHSAWSGEPTLVALFGTSAGEFYRTDDFLGSTTKYTIPSGRPIVSIQCYNTAPLSFDWWFIADDSGNLYVFVHRMENGDYGIGLYMSDGKLTKSTIKFTQSSPPINGSEIFTATSYVELAGGDSGDPDTMLRVGSGQLNNQQSVGNTFSWAIGENIYGGVVGGNPVPPFTGAIRDAILAAGPGHSAQAVDGFLYFGSYLGPGQAVLPSIARFGVIFTSGVDPRVWFHDGTAWLPATGLTPAINGVALAGGFDPSFKLAVLEQLKTFSADDGVAYVEGSTGSPSQIRQIAWELGLFGVYLGAADDGIVKSLNGGDSWGYIRPHAGVGTTWPVGADGKQVAVAFTVPPPCPNVYSLSRSGGADDNLLNLAGNAWQLIENTRSGDAFGLQYLGGEGRMIHLVDSDLPQISFDYGLTWQASNTPPVGFPICSAVAMDGAGERLWGLWRDGNTVTGDTHAIAYSTDWGDTWTISATDGTVLHYYLAIACHPTDVNRIVVTGGHTLTSFTWKTTDRGANWTQAAGPGLQNGLVYVDHSSPSAGFKSQCVTFSPYGRIIWSTGGRTATGDVYYSDDFGATWTQAAYDVNPPFGEGMMQMLRCGPFGPYYTVHFSRNAATTNIFRSDDHGAHWVAVPEPDSDLGGYNGIGYDPLNNTVLFHRNDASEVWGLDPVSGVWSDLTYNYNSIGGAAGPVTQPLTFVGDPAVAGP